MAWFKRTDKGIQTPTEEKKDKAFIIQVNGRLYGHKRCKTSLYVRIVIIMAV